MRKLFYIDYPQTHYEGQLHRYHCAFCKQETTKINGLLEGHLANCDYRIAMEKAGYECYSKRIEPSLETIDEED